MLVSAEISETLEINYNDQERKVEITRWPEFFGKWSSYEADAWLALQPAEAVALRDHLNTIIAERGLA